jgi:hypothetical protein
MAHHGWGKQKQNKKQVTNYNFDSTNGIIRYEDYRKKILHASVC